jgi:hypothetical protein
MRIKDMHGNLQAFLESRAIRVVNYWTEKLNF